MLIKNGSLRLFQLVGVDVFVHWSWGLAAIVEITRNNNRAVFAGDSVHSLSFYVAQYLCLFLIVLLHEFGHALACKSVGGTADRIVLWPLGGLAFVKPPQRPGASLWTAVAGPLVNVVLLPMTLIPLIMMNLVHPGHGQAFDFLLELAVINVILLVFNMLPIYPLDGGQILRACLWFVIGRGRSLVIAATVGVIGAMVVAGLAFVAGQIFLALFVIFMGLRSFQSIKMGSAMRGMDKAPRHADARCPACKENPPIGEFWKCSCGAKFDTFASGAQCPECPKTFATTMCPLCAISNPLAHWYSTGGFTVSPHLSVPEAPAV